MINIFMYILVFCQISFAQITTIISPEVIGSAGNTMQESGYILSSTLGELAVETISSNSEYILTQGFQQQNSPVSANITHPVTNTIDIFPNPTKSDVMINFTDKYNYADIRIINIYGAIVRNKTIKTFQSSESITLQNLPQGTYFLELRLDFKKPIIHQIYKIN